eukprot:scaffold126650_cov33-Tisochrysis_lutea.AAC.5
MGGAEVGKDPNAYHGPYGERIAGRRLPLARELESDWYMRKGELARHLEGWGARESESHARGRRGRRVVLRAARTSTQITEVSANSAPNKTRTANRSVGLRIRMGAITQPQRAKA